MKVTALPVEANPSCRQATLASGVPQKSSHTVPHTLLLHISTRPWLEFDPPRSLMSPWTQPTHIQSKETWHDCHSSLALPSYLMLTLTFNTSIFKVGTVMNASSIAGTVLKPGLCSNTPHIVIHNGSSSLTKISKGAGNCTCRNKL